MEEKTASAQERERGKVNSLEQSDVTQLPPSFIPPSSPPYEGCVGPGERKKGEVRGRDGRKRQIQK